MHLTPLHYGLSNAIFIQHVLLPLFAVPTAVTTMPPKSVFWELFRTRKDGDIVQKYKNDSVHNSAYCLGELALYMKRIRDEEAEEMEDGVLERLSDNVVMKAGTQDDCTPKPTWTQRS